MKVIFLDVDGVLNTSKIFDRIYISTGKSELEIDEFRLKYLKTIVDKTDAKIVLSSTWRNFFMKEDNKIIPRNNKGKKFNDLLTNYDIEIFDILSNNYSDINRENLVNEWLSNRDDIDDFIIIDDEPNMFKSLLDKLIKTSKVNNNEMLINMDDCIGLCEEHINKAIEMLNSKVKVLKK